MTKGRTKHSNHTLTKAALPEGTTVHPAPTLHSVIHSENVRRLLALPKRIEPITLRVVQKFSRAGAYLELSKGNSNA